MTPYGKVAQAAIAAMSLLAEQYSPVGGRRLNSREIAEQRKLSQAIVGKVLTKLSQTGLVSGSPGPGGGYALARPPQAITLNEVVAPFDRLDSTLMCPFGEGWCGTGPQCPLHAQLDQLRQQISNFLQQTTLARFQLAAQSEPQDLTHSPGLSHGHFSTPRSP
jgi:Rrf2 family protein